MLSAPLVICDMLYCICQQNERGLCSLFVLWHTASLSENRIFAFRANLAGDLCLLLHWEGFLVFPRSLRNSQARLVFFLCLFLHSSVLTGMKSHQLHLPTGQVKHGQWLRQLRILWLPFRVFLAWGRMAKWTMS